MRSFQVRQSAAAWSLLAAALFLLSCDKSRSLHTAVDSSVTNEAIVESESGHIQGRWEQNAEDEQIRLDRHPERLETPTRVASGMRVFIEGNVIHLQPPHYVVDGKTDTETPPPIAVWEFTLKTTDGGDNFTILMRPTGIDKLFRLNYRRDENQMTIFTQGQELVLHRTLDKPKE